MSSIAVSAVPWEWSCQESRLVGARDISSCKTDGSGTTCTTYDQNVTVDCAYGCDNVTKACSPPTYQVNFMLIGGFLAVMGLVAFILKKTR